MHGSPWAAVHLMKMARTVQEHIETIIYEDVEDFIRAAHISPVPAAHIQDRQLWVRVGVGGLVRSPVPPNGCYKTASFGSEPRSGGVGQPEVSSR